MNIDLKDKKILWLLDYDARMPLNELAKQVRLSKPNTHYRLKQLQEKGIIRQFVSVIDLHKLGFLTYRIYIRYSNMRVEDEQKMIANLKKNPWIVWLITCTGSWDLEIVFTAKNYLHLNQILEDFNEQWGGKFARIDISMSIANHHFKRDYLIDAPRHPQEVARYGYEPETTALNKTNISILQSIANNCRGSNASIGATIGATHHTVKTHIKKLEKKGIISAHRILINWDALGRQYLKLLLKFNHTNRQTKNTIISWCAKNKEVVYVIEVLGRWDFEIEIETEDPHKASAIIRQLRNEFPDLLTDYQILNVTREEHLNYLPPGVIKEQ